MAYRRLGELLLAAGTISEEELQKGLELQKGGKDRLGTVLIDNGIITEEELIGALQAQLGIEFIDLTRISIPTELAQVIPKNIAKQYQIVPVRVAKGRLYLAMSDPLNFYAIEAARKASHKRVEPMVAKSGAIQHAIQALYSNEDAAQAIEEMKREQYAAGDAGAVTDTAFVSTTLGEDAVEAAPTIRLVNSIIERAINERASDIHLECREEEMRVRMRVDGLMRDVLTVPRDIQSSVISRVKVMAGMDIAERRVPQDGRFTVKIRDKEIDLRVSTLPTVYGEKIVARLLDKSAGAITTESIGLDGANLEKFERILRSRYGVILIVGPTGSGKSTTMYAMIDRLNTREVNLLTLEDPVEYNIDDVNQVQINEKTGMTFAGGLRAILRQDPDIIAVGEIRDGETAEIAMRAAITGHLVLSTIHTSDAVGAIDRLRNIGVEPYMTASALRGVISQRLVRRICPHCKTQYVPKKKELTSLGIKTDEEVVFYRGEGCAECYNSGYSGRTAVFEILVVDETLETMIAENKSRAEILSRLRRSKGGYATLMDDAARLVLAGVTTSEEALRVVNDRN